MRETQQEIAHILIMKFLSNSDVRKEGVKEMWIKPKNSSSNTQASLERTAIFDNHWISYRDYLKEIILFFDRLKLQITENITSHKCNQVKNINYIL